MQKHHFFAPGGLNELGCQALSEFPSSPVSTFPARPCELAMGCVLILAHLPPVISKLNLWHIYTLISAWINYSSTWSWTVSSQEGEGISCCIVTGGSFLSCVLPSWLYLLTGVFLRLTIFKAACSEIITISNLPVCKISLYYFKETTLSLNTAYAVLKFE